MDIILKSVSIKIPSNNDLRSYNEENDFERIEVCSSPNDSIQNQLDRDYLDENEFNIEKEKTKDSYKNNSKKKLNVLDFDTNNDDFDYLGLNIDRPVTSKEILDSMKKRIILNDSENNSTNFLNRIRDEKTQRSMTYNQFENHTLPKKNSVYNFCNVNNHADFTEKGHFIDQKYKSNGLHLKFSNFNPRKKKKSIDYDQLLECLCKFLKHKSRNTFAYLPK
jgi:hypothetical protein